ncbi:hypothetical protein O6H91_22G051700 [Diphasiastrum complanatum]|uniref:Uncharacterized protein n=1 Tax=Diphasiastrum complanatum TaxID=34168 RepID=A0ACC2AFG7_DIPCM|nr:hypothetical protein O6H91_22G051700 [Diphasiastrum complanatum]
MWKNPRFFCQMSLHLQKRLWQAMLLRLSISAPSPHACVTICKSTGVCHSRMLLPYPQMFQHLLRKLLHRHRMSRLILRRDLLHIVAVLEDIGIPRKKVWNLIRRENKLTQVSVEEIASNLQTLEDFGVKKKHFRQVVQRCPSILLGDLKEVLSPLAHQLEELGVDYNQIISHNLEYNSQRVIISGAAKLQELRNIYLQHGLSIPELAKALRRYPRLLAFVSESNWTKSLEYLKGLSLGDNDFGQLIKRNPPLLTCSIQSNLKLKIDFLASIGVSKDNLPRILKRCPTLFCCSIEQNLKPKMKYLQSVGMQGNDLGKIVTLRPSILGRSLTKGFSEKVNFLIVLGFETGSPQFVRALGCLFSASLDTLESRMKQLGELGFTLSEIFLMVKRNPNLLSTSNKQFQAKIEFLMNIMEYSLKDLVSYPVYFNLNLQGRIIPRHRVLSWLRSHGKLNKSSSLSYIVALSEKRFQAKFIETYPGCRDVFEGLKTMEPLVSSA